MIPFSAGVTTCPPQTPKQFPVLHKIIPHLNDIDRAVFSHDYLKLFTILHPRLILNPYIDTHTHHDLDSFLRNIITNMEKNAYKFSPAHRSSEDSHSRPFVAMNMKL